jgi:DNA repair protein RAD5
LLRAAELEDEKAQKAQSSTQAKEPGQSSDEDEADKLEQDQLDTLYQKAQRFDFNTPEARPADGFTMDLRKYQKQALHWMLGKEKDSSSRRLVSMHPLWEEYCWPEKDVDDNALPRVRGQDKFYVNPYSGELSLEFPVQEQNCLGGILADEMGLGKTIEMLSLIHSHRPEPEASTKSHPAMPFVDYSSLTPSLSSRKPVPAPHTTLVVAPTSLLSQWESEAMKASEPGTMKVLVYYGSDKAVDLRSLCHSWNSADAPNLIITSYGVVRSEHGRMASNSSRNDMPNTGLFSVEFFRIILDEAHYIKNRASKTARACYDLNAVHRWVLTGTPIVNRLEDLYSLVRFLKVEPWNNFSFWKTFITVPFESKDFARALSVVQTVLEPLVLRRTKTMRTPDGEPLVPLPPRTINIEEIELSQQEREIYDIIFSRAKRTFNDNIAAGTLLKSYTTIFAQLLRLRQTCCHPVLTRNQDIVADEEDSAVAADAANSLKDDMDLQDLINKFTASTENGSEDRDATSRFSAHALKQIQNESIGECPICSEEPMIEPAVTACWHSACKNCLQSFIRHETDKHRQPRCFSCREVVNPRDIFEVVRHQTPIHPFMKQDSSDETGSVPSSPPPRISLRRVNPLSPSAHTSAKIHALVNHLTRLRPNTKAVVFSQFTSFLDLIGPQLTRAGIEHLRFDGTMHQKARASVLAQFCSTDTFSDEEEDDDEDAGTPKAGPSSNGPVKPDRGARSPSPSVLLISLRAGGVGLNLTAANHVYMMDPWWSFAVEAQAIDRVHRMGQLRDVTVTRFVVKDSIEVRMLRIQERKMMIAGSLGLRVGGDGTEEDRRKERIEELKLLFE